MQTAIAASSVEVEVPDDQASRQRGAQVAANVCLGCHGFKYLRFSDLQALNLSVKELDAIRAGEDLNSALVSFTPADVSRDLYGVVPPDLSLMDKAREGGAGYVYALLTSYYVDENGATDNRIYPGLSMPDVFGYSSATTAEERAEIERQALDVAAFLVWAADPKAEQRMRIGYAVLIYLVVFAVLLYLLKQRIWSRLD